MRDPLLFINEPFFSYDRVAEMSALLENQPFRELLVNGVLPYCDIRTVSRLERTSRTAHELVKANLKTIRR